MANSLVSYLLNTSRLKIVDEQYSITVWQDLKVKRVEVAAQAQTAQNPQSNAYIATNEQLTAAQQADLLTTKVLQPVSLTAEVFVESISTAMAIAVAFQVQTKTFTITAKGLVAQGMSISNVKIDQENTMLSAIRVTLTFEQADIPTTNAYDPTSSSDSDTYGIKVEPTSGIVATVQSVYNKVSSLWS